MIIGCDVGTIGFRIKCFLQERDVGGGAIAYEDDWTFANLTSAAHVGSSARGTNNMRNSAPLLKHYWNVSGQDRQRIIACAQVSFVTGLCRSELWTNRWLSLLLTKFEKTKYKLSIFHCNISKLLIVDPNSELYPPILITLLSTLRNHAALTH